MAPPTSTSRPQLPGFTFDVATNRYVKILQNHHARAVGGAAERAAAQAVHKEEERASKKQRVEEARERDLRSRPCQVARSRIRQHAIIGSALARQTGSSSHTPSTADTQTLLRGATTRMRCWTQLEKNGSLYMLRRWPATGGYLSVESLARHAASNVIMFRHKDTNKQQTYFDLPGGQPTSITIWKDLAMVTTFSSDQADVIVKLSDHSRNSNLEATPRRKSTKHHNYWCASFNGARSQMAIGSDFATIIDDLNHSSAQASFNHSQDTSLKSASPAYDITWQNSHIVASGLRNGAIHLFDIRAKSSVLRLRHQTAAMRLHCIGSEKILAGGPRALTMYDLRFNKLAHKTRKSKPWLTYRDYDNTRWKPRDLDICPEKGLLAMGLEEGVELRNLWTGDVVRKLDDKMEAQAVSFVHDEGFWDDAHHGDELLIADNTTIEEWTI